MNHDEFPEELPSVEREHPWLVIVYVIVGAAAFAASFQWPMGFAA